MHPATLLLEPAVGVPAGFSAASVPVHRASTVLFKDADSFAARGRQLYDGYTYGLYGTPTTEALARKLAVLEGAERVLLAPSGLAAIHLVNLAVLRAGDHLLLSDAMYGPTRRAATDLLAGLGIEVEFYPPQCGSAIARLLRPETRLVWIESPASLTMEMQDVRAIVSAARKSGAQVAMDNTWATPLRLRPLAMGVDFSVQALTKFVAAHADVLMGSIAVSDAAIFRRLRDMQGLTGIAVSPDDCSLVLRGLETLDLRLERQTSTALAIARWLEQQPAVGQVLFPPLASDPGHALWKRDCRGAGSVLSLRLRDTGWPAARRFADALRLFRLGASWGGVHSLVAPYPSAPERRFGPPSNPQSAAAISGALLRLSVGLEDPRDLIEDLRRAVRAAAPSKRRKKS